MSDLKFPNYDKEQIAKNKIDTVFLISASKPRNPSIESDTFGFINYDTAGNKISDYRHGPLWGITNDYQYDNHGFLIDITCNTDFQTHFSAKYYYNPDSLILYQIWKGESKDTCVFHFDSNGRLIDSEEYQHSSSGSLRHSKTNYEYGISNKLIKTTVNHMTTIDEQKGAARIGVELPVRTVSMYFYSSDKLDSIISSTFHKEESNNTISKTSYNDQGLIGQVVYENTITNYAYKKRRD